MGISLDQKGFIKMWFVIIEFLSSNFFIINNYNTLFWHTCFGIGLHYKKNASYLFIQILLLAASRVNQWQKWFFLFSNFSAVKLCICEHVLAVLKSVLLSQLSRRVSGWPAHFSSQQPLSSLFYTPWVMQLFY